MKYRKDSILTTGQVSEICRVVPKTVSKWVDSGRLAGYRIPGSRDRRIVLSDLLRFMRANGIPTSNIEGNRRKILLLGKDCEPFRKIREILSDDSAYIVEHQHSIFGAGLATEELCPHILFIDTNDSSLSARQICRTLHEYRQFQYTRIIALCPHLTPGETRALIHSGFDGALVRPFSSDQLMAAIKKFTITEH